MVTDKRHIPSLIIMSIAAFLLLTYIIMAFISYFSLNKNEYSLQSTDIVGLTRLLILLSVYICFILFFALKSKRPIFNLSIGLLLIFLIDVFNSLYLYIFVYNIFDNRDAYIQIIISELFQTLTSFLTSVSFTLYSFGKKFKYPVVILLTINIAVQGQTFVRYMPIYFNQSISLYGIISSFQNIYRILFYLSLLIFVILYKKLLSDSANKISDKPVEYIYDI